MSMKMSSSAAAEAVREYAAQTTGSETFYRGLFGVSYTEGIKFLADTCGAYWLIDAVASHQLSLRRRLDGLPEFQVWRLRRALPDSPESGYLLEAWSDTPDQSSLLARQHIEYTDFPEELMPFEWWVEGQTMMLKEER